MQGLTKKVVGTPPSTSLLRYALSLSLCVCVSLSLFPSLSLSLSYYPFEINR